MLAETIDSINILNATKKAMLLSVNNLKNTPQKLLIDGNQLLDTKIEQEAIVKGDQKIAEISAASIIAKVSRDKIVDSYDKVFPMYNLSKHKGYGTKHHVYTLNQYGPSSIHRKTFRPVLEINENSIIQMIVKNKEDKNILDLLDELIQDHKDQSNLKKIESLEQKLINNLDENSYSELIKLKSQLNRE